MPGRLLAIWLQSTALMRRNHTKQTLNAFSLFEHHQHHRSSSSTTTITKDPRKKKEKKKPKTTGQAKRSLQLQHLPVAAPK